jgi:hypothetical protein
MLMGIVVLFLVTVLVIFASRCRALNRQEIDFQISLLAIALAPLTTIYSPLQDSIAVALFLLYVPNGDVRLNFDSMRTIALLLFLLPTDFSTLNFLLLATLGIALLFQTRIDLRALFLLFALLVYSMEIHWYDHLIYDLAGIGVLILSTKTTWDTMKFLFKK